MGFRRLGDLEREGIITKVKSFLSSRKEIVLAYLFGSFISGGEFQDIDLAILIDENQTDIPIYRYPLRLSSELEVFLGKPRIEWDVKLLFRSPIHFQYRVIKTGLLILCQDELARVKYETRVLREYLDYKLTLDFFDRKLLEAIKE